MEKNPVNQGVLSLKSSGIGTATRARVPTPARDAAMK
jgi:hypothetical protein